MSLSANEQMSLSARLIFSLKKSNCDITSVQWALQRDREFVFVCPGLSWQETVCKLTK